MPVGYSICILQSNHVANDKLEVAMREVINGYSRFWLPKLWADAKRFARMFTFKVTTLGATEGFILNKEEEKLGVQKGDTL